MHNSVWGIKKWLIHLSVDLYSVYDHKSADMSAASQVFRSQFQDITHKYNYSRILHESKESNNGPLRVHYWGTGVIWGFNYSQILLVSKEINKGPLGIYFWGGGGHFGFYIHQISVHLTPWVLAKSECHYASIRPNMKDSLPKIWRFKYTYT